MYKTKKEWIEIEFNVILTCLRSSFFPFFSAQELLSLLKGDFSDLVSDSDPLLDTEPELDLFEVIEEIEESVSESDFELTLLESEADDFLLSESDPDSSEPHYNRNTFTLF